MKKRVFLLGITILALAFSLVLSACDNPSGGDDPSGTSNGDLLNAPGTPGQPQVTPGTGQLSVSWIGVSGATFYEVEYKKTDGSDSWHSWGGTITGTNTVITGLTNGAEYAVQLRAGNNAGFSSWSAPATGTPSGNQLNAPGTPGQPQVTPGTGQLSVSWTGVSGADSYEVEYKKTDGSDSWHSWGGTITGTNTVITGLTNGAEYAVRLRAGNSAGYSGWSAQATETPSGNLLSAPGTPGQPQVTPGNGQLSVSWTGVSDADSYEVEYKKTDGSDSWHSWGGTFTVTNTVITGLTNGAEYAVQLRAGNNAGFSGWSTQATGTPQGSGNAIINDLALSGKLNAPVKYEYPETWFNTEQYSASIAWQDMDGNPLYYNRFKTDTVYKALITLYANYGYTLQGVAENSFYFTGADSVSNQANSGDVIIIFPATGEPDPTDIVVGDPTVKLYLNGGETALEHNGTTILESAETGTFKISVAVENWNVISWRINGDQVASYINSISLPKRTAGIYIVTVEVGYDNASKNTGTHTFVIE